MDYQHCQEKKGSVSQRLAYLVSIGLLEKPKRGEYMLVEGKPLNQLKMRLAKQQLRALWHKIYQVIPKLREQLDSKEQERLEERLLSDLNELREQLDWDFS